MGAPHTHYMARALQLAELGLYTTSPNPRVGCVLVKDDRIVGQGYHQKAGSPHAEVNAIADAGPEAEGATAYVTLEPCSHFGKTPPCCDALIAAKVAKVVAAMQDPNPLVAGQGLEKLQAAGIETEVGVLESEARALNPGFFKRMSQGLPWVRVKMAISLDGRTAMASGESQWITGPEARSDVQRWRARADAILTGIGTIRHDDPRLTLRTDELNVPNADLISQRQPLRVVIDPRFETPAQSKLLQESGPVLLVGCSETESMKPLQDQGAETLCCPGDYGRVDLKAVLEALAARDVNEVHVEAGAVLTGALVQAGLVDELLIYQAPLIMGDQARGLFHLPQLNSMAEGYRLEITETRWVGQDQRIRARFVEA